MKSRILQLLVDVITALCYVISIIEEINERAVRPVSPYSAWEYVEIERVHRKDIVDGQVEKQVILNYQRVKILLRDQEQIRCLKCRTPNIYCDAQCSYTAWTEGLQ